MSYQEQDREYEDLTPKHWNHSFLKRPRKFLQNTLNFMQSQYKFTHFVDFWQFYQAADEVPEEQKHVIALLFEYISSI